MHGVLDLGYALFLLSFARLPGDVGAVSAIVLQLHAELMLLQDAKPLQLQGDVLEGVYGAHCRPVQSRFFHLPP
jgi:hypothetical protein